MKNKFKLLILLSSIITSYQVNAEYKIIIQLDPQGIILEENPINGVINFSKNTINRGENSTLSWNYDYANKVDVKDLGVYGKAGSVTVSPLASRNYQVEVTKGSQKKIENLFLTVVQPNQNISFTSNKTRIGIGQPLTLNWNVENAEYVDIDNGVGFGLPLIGNSTVYPTIDTTFRLKAKGYEGIEDANGYVTVDVVENSIINSFSASSLNITKGENVTFSWDVTDSEGLVLNPFGSVSGIPTGSQLVSFDTAGFYDFDLRSTSLNGTIISSTPIGINVYNPAVINSYTINGSNSSLNVSPSQSLVFDWTASDAISYKLNGSSISGNSTTLTAASVTGTTPYILTAFNGAGDSVTRSLSVNVVGLPVIDTFAAPTNVFTNTPLTLSWTGTGVSKYEIKSSNATSGLAITAFDLGSSTTTNATPTAAGTYTYTLSGYNTANSKVDSTKSVVVESDPTFTGFTVNGSTSISVSPSTALTFAGAGFSSGSALNGRNSANTADATLPTVASATAGTTTYYAAAEKVLNSITRNSAARSVSVTVINAPSIGTVTAPTNVFSSSAFTMSWSGTNAVNYKIRGNLATSGVSTSDVDLGTSTSSSITPTAAGTYTYTITATNAVGVTTTTTKSVVVESDPTFTGFTVNGSTSISVSPSTALTFAGAGFSSGSALNGSLPTVAPASAGTNTYYATASRTLNSITRNSASRSVSVTVINAPAIGTVTAPTNVFANAAFSMSWSGTNAVNYKIRGNIAASGITTTDVDLGTSTSSSITPTAAGTYTYTITATNAVGVTTTTTKSVVVESDPTISNASINSGVGFVNVSTGAALYPSATLSSGASLVSTVPTYASTNPGEYTYNFYATKYLNGVTRYSNTIQSVIGAGSRHTMYVGSYLEGTGAYNGFGYVDTAATGWHAYTASGFSPISVSGYAIYGFYTTNSNNELSKLYINYSIYTPDNILLGKKINVNGTLCAQTGTSFNIYVDSYQYNSCNVNFHNIVGQTIVVYVQN